jgi:hypothetical protein
MLNSCFVLMKVTYNGAKGNSEDWVLVVDHSYSHSV